MTICTCQWSPVSTVTVDPPHIVKRDPDCPMHGGQDLIYADLMAGRCSHTQAMDRLEAMGMTPFMAVETVAVWVQES